MTAPYFTHSDRALENSLITDTQYNDNMDSVEASFDLLPDPTDLTNSIVQYRQVALVSDSYTLTIAGVTSYEDGYTLRLSPLTNNTATSTIQINALGNVNIKRDNLSALEDGDLVANSSYTLTYVAASAAFILQSAPASIVDQVSEIYDQFDDRYLGAKATSPTLDNDGDPLIEGSIYFNTGTGLMYVWSGIVWSPLNRYIKTISDTPPELPYDGQEWFDTSSGIDYTFYIDEDLTGQWLQQPLMASDEAISIDVNTSLSTGSITSTGTIGTDTNIYFVDATSGDITATLPTAVGITGVNVHLKRIDTSGNSVVIDTTASETIDSYDSINLAIDQNLLIISDGTNWRIL